ncbi:MULTISPECIES: DNA phosphorothioation-dependent restriction protein DptF [Myroides]|uniref:DNA phosphorothioation-dependent restriction protein DptF n=1 Tax=Myroides TaxID=76831 RepID=UPI002575B88D|nr:MULTISPECIES: DNA phosphorothioation-dependent restriction protein DptF [Myroides]MDM1377706.1 DNA phosphorothioation-dependent restriction protein DptF [Myroides marinus]MDM1385090.1 DNA phosphorothioation-dependent restriction protein DptF [Myroides marinus]MDM1392190.1 DNA phosphorothioation-dependent restriction protein DptF [Myroides marinus]MEC4028521.1 DNA phosphorothioation-dependent restriction protein DptF [Myroides odoratimimus]
MSLNIFLQELQKLKESSRYAIANGIDAEIDEFKKYLHVEREVEVNLRSIIKKSCDLSGAQLILVCGNVGDGKSHILSYLRNTIPDEINKFHTHNDATESHNPTETSNETLYKLLDGFKDVNISNSSSKIILAINLGTLSKFIEEYKDEFKVLETYISKNRILESGLIEDNIFNENSSFHHINFTDYHLFSLTEEGPESKIISTILNLLVTPNKQNSIYSSYLNFKSTLSEKQFCPVLYNYEFLFEEKNRLVLTQLIIKSIISGKEIISIRTLLNFIYDLIVPVNFPIDNSNEIELVFDKENRQNSKLLSSLLPNYIFEHPELSSLFSKIKTLDPCIDRKEELDSHLLNYARHKNVENLFLKVIDKTYTNEILFLLKSSNLDDVTCKFFIRLNYFNKYFKDSYLRDIVYDDYLVWLFHFNNHNKVYIKKIYELFEYTARNWNGDPRANDKVVLAMDNRQDQYRIFKDFDLVPKVDTGIAELKESCLNRFTQDFVLSFEVNEEIITLNIDYGLYVILRRVKEGYRPNRKDGNNYIYFVEAINKLINKDIENSPIYIDEINIGQAIDYKFSRDHFGNYKFIQGR